MNTTRRIITICKQCNNISGYDLLYATWLDLKNGKNKPVSVTTSGYYGGSTYGGGSTYVSTYSTWVTNAVYVHPLQCTECPNPTSCLICLIHDGQLAGFMDKCNRCKHKYLCVTTGTEWVWFGETNYYEEMEKVNDTIVKRGSKTKGMGYSFFKTFKARFGKKQVLI